MQPVSLSIGQPLTQSMTGYIAGTQAGQSPAPAGSTAAAVTADQVDTTAAGNALLQQFLAADLVPSYDQPGYLQTSDVTFSCSGEASNFLSLLDDLADNYPSIQLQNFSITTRSFARRRKCPRSSWAFPSPPAALPQRTAPRPAAASTM